MPFCSSCGAKIIPGNKFCVECGTPVDQGAPSVTPASPEGPALITSPGKPGVNRKILLAAGIVVVCVILAAIVLSGIPPSKTGRSSASALVSPVTVTPTGYAIVSTPEPENTTTPVIPATAVIIQSERFGSKYEQIYGVSQNFSFGQKEVFSHDLTYPPLYIRFNLTPVIIDRHILVSIGTHEEHMANVTEVSPNAWFEVKVFNAVDGTLVDQQGFGKDYSDMTKQEFMIRQPGKYRVELSGHEVFADVSILTGIQ
jgi:hypothetical protein